METPLVRVEVSYHVTRPIVELFPCLKHKLVKESRGSCFRLLRVGISQAELEELARLSEENTAKDREKLERMMQYGQSAACRWRLLHDYFSERMEAEQCGTCDNCIHPLEDQFGLADQAKQVMAS